MNKLIVITGPTAVGKTNIAIQVAKLLKTEIISCDSRQIYKELTIGTAKPSPEELQEVPHHFINHISITDDYSVGHFQHEATKKIKELFKTNKYIVVTGGTGLYIQSLLYNLDNFPEVSKEIQQKYNEIYNKAGLKPLLDELEKKDILYYEKVDKSNARRLIRALSVIKASGKPYSNFLSKQTERKSHFDFHYFVLNRERSELYERINNRVDLMLKEGLLEEVNMLTSYVSLKALQTVGYQELFPYFEGSCTLEFAISKIKQHSRNYAKRQLTWFRKLENVTQLQVNSETVNSIIKIITNS